VFKVTEACLAEPVTLWRQQRGLCSTLWWQHTSVQGTEILGRVSYACVTLL